MIGNLIDRVFEYILVHFRWVLVIYVLLPLSVLYDAFYYIRCKLIFKLFSSPAKHNLRVKQVQKQVQEWHKNNVDQPMCTARPGWQTMSFRQGLYKQTMHRIHIDLMDILRVDPVMRVVRVEPLVTMGQLTAVLNPLGWTLPIVPELDDLTVGGLIMGTGVETSSHKYGLFQHICEAYELVLADGSVVTCTKNENSDLFYAIPWSYGSLGLLVSAELKIVPAKKYVKVEYIPVHTNKDMLRVLGEQIGKEEGNDFVEGLLFSKDEAVIMTGTMTNKCKVTQLNPIGKYHKPWFFTHVQRYLKKGYGIEYIPLRDYYHRHSRSLFWEIQDIIPFGNNCLFRHLCGWMVPPKVSLLKLTQTESIRKFYERYQIIQDILVPLADLKDTLNFFEERLKVYPLWLCPFKLFNDPGLVHPKNSDGEPVMYVDVGVYGIPKATSYEAKTTTREIEAFARKVNGFQMLYSDTFMTREEFYQMYDHSLYNQVRTSLDCTKAFPIIYDKINKDVRY